MRITVEQRRRRLVVGQLALSGVARGPEDVVDRLVALHATDSPSVYLSVLARVPGLTLADVRAALYERRTLVRVLAMRRTLFVVARDTVPVVHAGASLAVARRLRARLLKDLATLPTDPPVADAAAFLAAAEAQVQEALAEHGPADGAQLSRRAPVLRTAFLPTTDKAWDVRRTITTPLLALLSAEGRVVRGEPRGTWTSNRYVWAPVEQWLPGGIPELDEGEARERLARAWLAAFGPATERDLQWWTGWNLAQTRAALARLDVRDVEVELGDEPGSGVAPGVMLRDTDLDADASGPLEGHVALLPSLDPTPMGWTHRGWYLGPHRPHLFDSAGNVGATVWCAGRIVGAWAVRPDGEPAVRLLEDVGSDAAAAVDAEAHRIAALLDGTGVTASFPTPLYRELRG